MSIRDDYGADVASSYDRDRETEAVWRLENAFVERFFAERTPSSVLDVPVGTGRFLPYYRDAVRVIGVDVSEHMLVQARKRSCPAQSVSLRQGSALDPATELGQVDVVVCWRLFHLLSADEIRVSMDGFHRIARQNVLVQVFLPSRLSARVRRSVRRMVVRVCSVLGMTARSSPWGHIRAYARPRCFYEQIFRDTRFEIESSTELGDSDGQPSVVYVLRGSR